MILFPSHRARIAPCVAAALLLAGWACPRPAGAGPARPIHVLYVCDTKDSAQAAAACAEIMEDLGRDAIYLDFLNRPGQFTDDDVTRYDLIVGSSEVKDAIALRAVIGGRVKPGAIAAWRNFLASREPERREPNPNVANYEKRPKALTFQHPYSVKGSMERTQVPADMSLEFFAGEPDIMKPMAFAWDERGRLWVAETRDYPHGVAEGGKGNDDIKICEDTDGDGRADKFIVFAGDLSLPTSLTFANGGVIVAQPPRFLFLKDTDGDDKADERSVLMDGWGIRDTHAQASNLHHGMDNWLYGCVGYSGFKGDIAGKHLEFAMGTYRFKSDGSAIEFLHQFTNNAWAWGINDAGDQFGGTANAAPFFYGGIPATAYPPGIRAVTAKKINLVDRCHAITPNYRQVDVFGTDPATGRHWGGYTAAAGSAFIYSANLPPRLQGKAMVCEPTMKLIALMEPRQVGAGYEADDGMNLVASTDEWMSPVFAEVGPDGAVWFADWQNFIIQHNPTPSVERGGYKAETGPGGAHINDLRDHSRGRIYRVVWDKARKPAITSLKGASQGDLLKALGSDTQFWRLKAQQMLVEGKAIDAAEDLRKLVAANNGGIAAVHALWTLHGLGRLDDATHRAALLAKDARLRRNAVRALGCDGPAHALLFGSGVISDQDLVTRLAAFVKLGDFPTTPEIKTLVPRLGADLVVKQDEWLAEAAHLLAKKHGATSFREGPDLLANGGLEKIGADGAPEGWKRRDYNRNPGTMNAEWEVVSGEAGAHGGKRALRCITRADGDTSYHQEVAIRPNTTYRLSGWVKTHALKGKVSFNDHIGRAETARLTARDSGWVEVETVFESNNRTKASINILHVAKGDGYFDDVRLCELIPIEAEAGRPLAGDAKRGEAIFFRHPVAACALCHVLGGKGSAVGPALDGIAGRKDEAYILESLTKPNARLAEGFEKLGVSPMPPVNLIMKPQEFEDVKAFILSLKEVPKLRP